MNKTFSSLLLLTVLLLSACTSSPQKSSANYVVDLEERKKITLPIDERTYYLSRSIFQFEEEGREYLHFENTELGQYDIVIFDLAKQSEHKRISLSKDGPNEVIGLIGSRTYNDSTIYLFEHSIGRTSVMNGEGKVTNRYQVQGADGVYLQNIVSSYFHMPSFIKDSVIYVSQNLSKRNIKKEEWKNIPIFASLNMKDSTIEMVPLFYPSIIDKDVDNPAGGYEFSYDYNYKDRRLICSFQGYDSLMVSDDLKTVKWYDGRSRYLQSMRPSIIMVFASVLRKNRFIKVISFNDSKHSCYYLGP